MEAAQRSASADFGRPSARPCPSHLARRAQFPLPREIQTREHLLPRFCTRCLRRLPQIVDPCNPWPEQLAMNFLTLNSFGTVAGLGIFPRVFGTEAVWFVSSNRLYREAAPSAPRASLRVTAVAPAHSDLQDPEFRKNCRYLRISLALRLSLHFLPRSRRYLSLSDCP